ncbi:hypothetical protein [Noviherbaspirillum malthae]|uniref:hypothetical protein n=1 Tax=Noviherbaspirillum malthae TaxID=1260987 RepID=UPI00188EFFA8|nr:hypothetical protein [Noviherbaspirillum malthae]
MDNAFCSFRSNVTTNPIWTEKYRSRSKGCATKGQDKDGKQAQKSFDTNAAMRTDTALPSRIRITAIVSSSFVADAFAHCAGVDYDLLRETPSILVELQNIYVPLSTAPKR